MSDFNEDLCAPPTLFPLPPLPPSPPADLPPDPRKKKDIDWTIPMPFTGGAEISPCKNYRYSLYRRWQEGGKKILFIGVNPSTDEALDDNTVVRLKNFARRDGYGEFWLGNVNPYRSTNPKNLRDVPADYNDENNREKIRHMANDADRIVACWGNNVILCPHWDNFVTWICTNYEIWCFGKTKSGHPKHPLRLPADTLYSRYYHHSKNEESSKETHEVSDEEFQ